MCFLQILFESFPKEEAELCNPDLRCIEDGYEGNYYSYFNYTARNLETKVGKGHNYCLQVNNDGAYDIITREDEEKIYGDDQPTINYNALAKCDNFGGGTGDGIWTKDGCKGNSAWCQGYADVVETSDGIVSVDNPELCRNNTFWLKSNISCDWHFDNKVAFIGSRCTGDMKHCYYPWYSRYNANPSSNGLANTCLDKSDHVFPLNTSCKLFNSKFLDTYNELWCSDINNTERKTGSQCSDLRGRFYSITYTSYDIL